MLWRRYNRVLKQRNAALRQSNPMVIDSLDPQLVSLGEQLHQAREKHVNSLCQMLQEKLPLFSQTLEAIDLTYKKGWKGDDLERAIARSRPRDMERGSTGPGPHKADLLLTLEGTPAKDRLSRGEQKAMTAAMVLAQAQLITESGERPVLMLDDLSSEFDEQHLDKVLAAGMELGVQIWVTGTQLAPAIKAREGDCRVFHVEHGKVSANST